MKIKILYFSGTGNTKLITHEIAKKLNVNNIEIVKVEDAINETSLLKIDSKETVLGIGFPVYDLLPPEIINKCIDLLPIKKDPVPVFIYSTMAFIKGDCLNIAARKLKKKGYYTIAKFGFNCPSNGVITYEQPDHPRYRNAYFEAGIDKVIDKFAKEVITRFNDFRKRPKAKVGGIYPHYNLVRFFSERTYGDKYYQDLKINGDCNNCNACVKACPVNNLQTINGYTTIINDNNCLRCLRCVALCPNKAITFTSSELVKQYNSSLIKKLYNEACQNN